MLPSLIRRLPVVLLLLMSGRAFGQYALTGQVVDAGGQPLAFANVLLLNPQDSSLVRGALTDDAGEFRIEFATPGAFLVKAAMVGMKDAITGPVVVTGSRPTAVAGTLILAEDAVMMNEVQVVAERALFEQQVDRTIVNVAGVATASGISALEVLERSPGLIINRPNNSIAMSGKEGVVLMINGRITYMPMEAVFQMLAGMNSDNIDKIELITTPPSKYDAEGNAGFINIVLKKNPNEGLSGSYNLTAGYGEGFRGAAGLSTAYIKGKWALTADYTYTYNDVDQIFAFYRENKVGEDDIITDSYNDRQSVRNNHNLRPGGRTSA